MAREGVYYRLYQAQVRNVDAEELGGGTAWPALPPPQHPQKAEEAQS